MKVWDPALRSIAEEALLRVRDTYATARTPHVTPKPRPSSD
jgi:hypothetical protein